jgi:hypothetical protein
MRIVFSENGRGKFREALPSLEQVPGVSPFPAWRKEKFFNSSLHGWDRNREVSVPTGGCPNLAT